MYVKEIPRKSKVRLVWSGAPGELYRLESPLTSYVIWQIAYICICMYSISLINGKTYWTSGAAAGPMHLGRCIVPRFPPSLRFYLSFFFLFLFSYLPLSFNVVIVAKSETGSEKPGPLSFSFFSFLIILFLLFLSPFFFLNFYLRYNLDDISGTLINKQCMYANGRSRVFLLLYVLFCFFSFDLPTTSQWWFNVIQEC